MQTQLAEPFKKIPEAEEIKEILQACVHCGFCTAVCPTYQLSGDELDGPRGRIYLLKQMLQGETVTGLTQQHLDRCLSCRSCETACPSGVKYGRLRDIGQRLLDQKVRRPILQDIQRFLIKQIFPYRQRFNAVIRLARLVKPVLPSHLQQKIPAKSIAPRWPEIRHKRKMLIVTGCVQPVLAPEIDVATAKVLDKLSISLVKIDSVSCCGGLNYHLSDHQQAKAFAKNYIDACWPFIEQGVEAVVSTASGCGVMIKEYAELLQYDEQYAKKAVKFSSLVKDISEILGHEDLVGFKDKNRPKIAFQAPCTLQHGQKLTGVVENILTRAGFDLVDVENNHLCCGSAGVYSILQPVLSGQLLENKLESLQSNAPELIVTANIGCLSHLQTKSTVKVQHWIELLA